ncbi:hypothetical protein MtrunA17_Chr5g0398301 [Medicago truncatula]|uniref:Transmembrane protein n=1 Tax=Medicago truncatula TaxID=3880 RepID=I3SW98_MEDTR|nr:unknown [Medicago truncatula]RHN53666.1 hypothetical protein MtrunA17_Chr5g0398301 [Medicago truncatula]
MRHSFFGIIFLLLLILPKKFVMNMLSKSARWKPCWFFFSYKFRKWLQNNFLLRWFTKHCPRYSNFFLIHQSTMKDTFVLSIAKYLNCVTNMHEN